MSHLKSLLLAFVFIHGAHQLSAQESIRPFDSLQLVDLNWDYQYVADILNDKGSTLLIFWATWNAPAKRLLMHIDNMHKELVEKTGAKVVVIAIDDERTSGKVPTYIEAKGWKFDVYFNPDRKLLHGLNVSLAPPLTFILDESGTIIYSHHGYAPGDENEIFEYLLTVE